MVDRDRPLNVAFNCSTSVARQRAGRQQDTTKSIVADYRATFIARKERRRHAAQPRGAGQPASQAQEDAEPATLNAFVDPTESAATSPRRRAFDERGAPAGPPANRDVWPPAGRMSSASREALERPERPEPPILRQEPTMTDLTTARRPHRGAEGRRQGTHPDPRRLVGRDVPDARSAEADYRGERFADSPGQMKGNNDILCLTRPDIVADLHDAVFRRRRRHLRDQHLLGAPPSPRPTTTSEPPRCATSTYEGARIARAVADRWTAEGAGQAALRRRLHRPAER